MNANEMMPSWAIENATPLDLAMTPVAAAVPGPQITRAAVPMNSAASFREDVTSAMYPPTTPQRGDASGVRGPHLLRASAGDWKERCSARPNGVPSSLSFGEADVNGRYASGRPQAPHRRGPSVIADSRRFHWLGTLLGRAHRGRRPPAGARGPRQRADAAHAHT